MKKTIKLSIQEIVIDFERLVRVEEHFTTLDDIDMLDEDNNQEFHEEMKEMVEKYLPTYRSHVPSEYFSDESTSRCKAEILCNILQENFREIFYQLV